jgi:hypothetical protein
MIKRTAAALLVTLFAAQARAQDRRLEATRIDPQPVPASAVPEGPARPHSVSSSDEGSGHQLFHVGAMFGLVSLPRPMDVEGFIGFADFVQAGFSFSDFPGIISDPLMKLVGAAAGGVSATLDEFTAWEGDLRVFPFRGSFFIGSSLGKQILRGRVTEGSPLGPQTATVDLDTLYVTPRIGWQSTFGAGFFYGFDVGVQLKVSGDVNVALPPGAPSDLQSSAQSLADAGSKYPLPSVHFRLGWML